MPDTDITKFQVIQNLSSHTGKNQGLPKQFSVRRMTPDQSLRGDKYIKGMEGRVNKGVITPFPQISVDLPELHVQGCFRKRRP